MDKRSSPHHILRSSLSCDELSNICIVGRHLAHASGYSWNLIIMQYISISIVSSYISMDLNDGDFNDTIASYIRLHLHDSTTNNYVFCFYHVM